MRSLAELSPHATVWAFRLSPSFRTGKNNSQLCCRTLTILAAHSKPPFLITSDANARFVKMADQACHLGGSLASESYLRGDKIIEIAKATGANAIHPGYGFLSENAEFAEQVAKAGIIFIGPTPESIRILGDKVHTPNGA